MSLVTSVLYANAEGKTEHICLDGKVSPSYGDDTLTFDDGKETFVVPIGRFIGAYTFEEKQGSSPVMTLIRGTSTSDIRDV